MAISDRPPFFRDFMPHLLQMREKTGRPHWVVMDEAHHLIPAESQPQTGLIGEQNTMFITVQPNLLSEALLEQINIVIAVGANAHQTIESYAIAAKLDPPIMQPTNLKAGEIMVWMRNTDSSPLIVQAYPSKQEHHRHHRKYAEGELPPERSFYFRGPEGKLNLRAQNLFTFLQLADGLDDATWDHHLRRGDYACWFRDAIKDEALAEATTRIAKLSATTPRETRQLIRSAIEQEYTLPGTLPLPVPGAS